MLSGLLHGFTGRLELFFVKLGEVLQVLSGFFDFAEFDKA